MNREEKADLLSELNELFNGAEVIVVSHYKGLTVKEFFFRNCATTFVKPVQVSEY